MDKINNILKDHIIESLKHSLKTTIALSYDHIPDCQLLQPNGFVANIENVTFKEISITASEFYVSSEHLLVIRDNCLYIYKYTDDLRFKQKSKREMCYILYKRRCCRRSIRMLMYKIYLDLIEAGVYRNDAWFEAIMAYLKIDQIDKADIFQNGLRVAYKSGEVRYFNTYLNVVDASALTPCNTVLGSVDRYITIGKSSVKTYKTDSKYIFKRKVGEIRHYIPFQKKLFLLLRDKIVVAKYE